MRDHQEHNAVQQEYFAGPLKPTMYPGSNPYVDRHVAEVIRFGGLKAGERVLDVGCGAGRYTFLLADRGMVMEGLELSPDLLKWLTHFDGGKYGMRTWCGDVANPAAELEGRFDAIAGFFMLHHLDDLRGAFAGLVKCLKPGGRMVFIEPNAWNPLYYLQVTFTPGMRWKAEKGIPNMRAGVLTPAMRAAGLVDVEYETFGFFPPVLRNTAWGGGVERVIERLPGVGPVRPFRLVRARKG